MGDLVIKEIYDRREFECQRQCSNDELIKKLESQSLFESPKEMNASPSMTKERHYLLRRLEKLKQQQISLKNERLFIEDLLS